MKKPRTRRGFLLPAPALRPVLHGIDNFGIRVILLNLFQGLPRK